MICIRYVCTPVKGLDIYEHTYLVTVRLQNKTSRHQSLHVLFEVKWFRLVIWHIFLKKKSEIKPPLHVEGPWEMVKRKKNKTLEFFRNLHDKIKWILVWFCPLLIFIRLFWISVQILLHLIETQMKWGYTLIQMPFLCPNMICVHKIVPISN